MWGDHIYHWRRQQGQRPTYGMCRDFYDLSNKGSANRALPIIIHRIAHQTVQARVSINRILEVTTTSQQNAANIHHLDKDHDETRHHTDMLHVEMIAAQIEMRVLQERQTAMESCLRGSESHKAGPSTRSQTRNK